jgi:Spy/CpxP family protein refolding chaperone
MKRIHTVVAGAVAGIALAAAAIVHAQPFGGMGPGFGPGMRMGPGHGPMAGVNPSVMADSRLTDLKTQLKITAAQEPAWQAFAAEAKQQANSMQAVRAKMQQSSGSAPERMEQRTTAMQERAATMATMTKAFNALYTTLTPEQKAIADQNFGMMGPRGMRFGPRAG